MLSVETSPTIHLAWRIITYQRSRFLASLAGIAFAVLLMLAELGFRNALLDSSLQAVQALEAEVFIEAEESEAFSGLRPMPRQRLAQALDAEGVLSAAPLYVDIRYFENQKDGSTRPIRLVGANPEDRVWRSPEIDRQRGALMMPLTALIDRRSRRQFYGDLEPGPAQVLATGIEIVGTFALGTDFRADGTLILGDRSFFAVTRNRGPDEIDLVLLRTRPGADPTRVARALGELLPDDVRVLTREEMLDQELAYWRDGTPIGLVFSLGLMMGFIVGVVICYQILYTDVVDHLKEFATLKAMGYANSELIAVVIAEALLLSVIASIPSLLVGWALYGLIAAATGLLLQLTLARAATIAGLTAAMCLIAGLWAVRKVLVADPADLY